MSKNGYCACGCGQRTTIAKQTDNRRGYVKGKPRRFIRGHYARMRNPNWKGGRTTVAGYIAIRCPNHPRTNPRGYVLEHILKAEKALGKPLPSKVEVHHFNEIRNDNRNSNLVVCQDRAYHRLLHRRLRALKADRKSVV